MMKSSQVVSTIEFQEFIKSCRDYCDLLEFELENDSIKYIIRIQKTLLKLYFNGMNLESIDLDLNIEFEEKIDAEKFDLVEIKLKKILEEHQYYWVVFDPTENIFENEPPVVGDLLDDILDIYKDIKRKLDVFDLNTEESIENAIWGMKFDFWHHWSSHAVDAIRYLHYVIEKVEKYK